MLPFTPTLEIHSEQNPQAVILKNPAETVRNGYFNRIEFLLTVTKDEGTMFHAAGLCICSIYSGVIPNMSGITLHLGLSIFWIRASFRHKLPCFGYARIQKIERPRYRVIPDM